MRVFLNIVKGLVILIGLGFIFYAVFYYIVKTHTVVSLKVTDNSITTYQYYDLVIVYISGCATALAVIVALFKEGIMNFFTSAKIVIKPKSSQILSEDYDRQLTKDIKAESYQVILNVMNSGSLHVDSCSISLTDLEYIDLLKHKSSVDVSMAKNINWIGKNEPIAHLHSYGGKADASILQIKINDASTFDEGQSQPVRLLIGGIDITNEHQHTKGHKWIATFMIAYDSHRPIKYKMEFDWDGRWHDRLSEMLKHSFEIREVKK